MGIHYFGDGDTWIPQKGIWPSKVELVEADGAAIYHNNGESKGKENGHHYLGFGFWRRKKIPEKFYSATPAWLLSDGRNPC